VSFTTTVSSDPKFFANMQNFSVNFPTGGIVFVQTGGYPEYVRRRNKVFWQTKS
jgi:hypothetical protein